jgi:hypothetical protein
MRQAMGVAVFAGMMGVTLFGLFPRLLRNGDEVWSEEKRQTNLRGTALNANESASFSGSLILRSANRDFSRRPNPVSAST